MRVNHHQRLFPFTFPQHFIRQELLQAFSKLSILYGSDVLYCRCSRRKTM